MAINPANIQLPYTPGVSCTLPNGNICAVCWWDENAQILGDQYGFFIAEGASQNGPFYINGADIATIPATDPNSALQIILTAAGITSTPQEWLANYNSTTIAQAVTNLLPGINKLGIISAINKYLAGIYPPGTTTVTTNTTTTATPITVSQILNYWLQNFTSLHPQANGTVILTSP